MPNIYNPIADSAPASSRTVERNGTHRDAILYRVSANAPHGVRCGKGDKRRAVTTLLSYAEYRVERPRNRVPVRGRQ